MRRLGTAGAAALALAGSSGCVEPSGFACERDEQCTQAKEGVCAADGCAYPDPACTSELRYGDAALGREGRCVEPESVAGTSSSGTAVESSSSSDAPSSSSSAGASTTDPDPDPVCGNGVVEGDERCDGADDCNDDCTTFGQLLDHRLIEMDGEETHLRGVVDIVDGELAVSGTVGTGDGRRAFVQRLGPALEERSTWMADGTSFANAISRIPSGALIMVSGGGDAALHGMGVELLDPSTVDLSADAAKAVSTVNSRALVLGQTDGGLFVESRSVTTGASWLSMNWRHQEPRGNQEVVEGIVDLDFREALLVGRRDEDFWVGHLLGADGSFSISTLFSIDGAGSRDTARAIVLAADDRVLVSGYLTTATESWDATVVAMDLQGTEAWRWTAEDPLQTHDEALAMDLDPNAPLVVVGGYVTALDRDAFLAKVRVDDGSPAWMRTYPEIEGNHKIHGVSVRSDGRILAVGDVDTAAGPRGWIGLFAP